MIIIGLTGSIGMGKTTAAGFFAAEGIPVNDADAVVHDLYAGEAVPLIEAAFPGTTIDGVVDRQALGTQLQKNPAKFRELEAIVHPLVGAREREFVERQRAAGSDLIVLDIPLLFETGGFKKVDLIAVVSCAAEIQRERVLARPNMTEEKFQLILSRQTPDEEKRTRADFIIDTGNAMEMTHQRIREIIATVRAKGKPGI